MNTILIVEDDGAIAVGLADTLQGEGYEVQVANTGTEALKFIALKEPALIVLDLNLPDMDGLDVLTHLRGRGLQFPVLILSARTLELDKVRGLDKGADDYLTKPFGLSELLARVRALLRRAQSAGKARVQLFCFGDIEIDLKKFTAKRKGQKLSLTTREFRLLEYFYLNKEQVLSREQILAAVWGRTYASGTRTVDVHIAKLRKKIEVDSESPCHLLTVRSAGYKFIP